MKITGTCAAYLSTDYSDSLDTIRQMDPNDAVHRFIFHSRDAAIDAWVRVGTAQITVEVAEYSEITNKTVKALKARQKAIQAKAELDCNKLQSQINSLLKLEYIPANE